MQASQSLRRPINWQDFETLCLKLWGEIWSYPEIKKNGRAGDAQCGVDIVGIPSGGQEYYGIQCKGKDNYTNKQFTKKEIDKEIENVKNFKPKLKKLYFATTAVKSAVIEEYVRLKNVENIGLGLFEVHLFSWEDITYLIDENRQTHDWYVNSQKYKSLHAVEVMFHDDSPEINLIAKFKEEVTYYRERIVHPNSEILGDSRLSNILFNSQERAEWKMVTKDLYSKKITNLSYVGFSLMIKNTGSTKLEDYKLKLNFEGKIADLAYKNVEKTGLALLNPRLNVYRDIWLDKENKTGQVVPEKGILVGDDVYISDVIFIKPLVEQTSILIKWKLVSSNFKESGSLILNVSPNIEQTQKTILVSDPLKIGKVENKIEDYFLEEEIS